LAAYRDAGASGVFTPGLFDPAAIQTVATTVALPLNVLWQPGVASVSTGSTLYRHALAAALDAAAAARTATAPTTRPIEYQQLQQHLHLRRRDDR